MISAALLALVRPIAERFGVEGHRVYLVGGIVRDELLAPGADDWVDVDLTTDARPDVVRRLVAPIANAVWAQGERFGTIGCRIGATPFEITTFRGEAYDPSSRKPDVVFADSLADDLARRDFTINAMAVDAVDGSLHDPYGGRADLEARVLRTPLGADTSFSDDPLRMLRAARFLARFDLTAAADIDDAIVRQRHRLAIVSAERVRDELHKLLHVAEPERGLRFLVEHGLIDRWLPELGRLAAVHDPLDGTLDALTHTCRVISACPDDTELRMAALVHDLAKADGAVHDHAARSAVHDHAARSAVHDHAARSAVHDHAARSAAIASTRLRDLRHSTDAQRTVRTLVALHHRLDQREWSAPDVRRLLIDAGDELGRVRLLAGANATARDDDHVRADRLAALVAFDAAVAALGETAAEQRAELDGDEVMAVLGIGPGRDVGAAQQFLRELRIVHGPLGRDAVVDALRDWWRRRST